MLSLQLHIKPDFNFFEGFKGSYPGSFKGSYKGLQSCVNVQVRVGLGFNSNVKGRGLRPLRFWA